MFEDLNSALNWSAEDPPWHGLVLIKDAAPTCEGTLLLHHFIALHLRAERNVCLIGFEQSLQHYVAVSRRFGIQLQAEAQAGRFTFVDAFSEPFASQEAAAREAERPHGEKETGSISFSITPRDLKGSVRRFTQLISKVVAEHRGEPARAGPLVVIDSLSTFLDSSPEGEHAAVTELVHHLRVLSKDQALGCSIVILAQAPPSPLPPTDKTVLSAEYVADLILEVSPLASGHSSAVHGQLLIRRGTQHPCGESFDESEKMLQFKAKDNTVNFFPPGLFKG